MLCDVQVWRPRRGCECGLIPAAVAGLGELGVASAAAMGRAELEAWEVHISLCHIDRWPRHFVYSSSALRFSPGREHA